MNTRIKINTLIKKLQKVNSEITNLQSTCTHENFTGEYKADTGNWCQSDDSYWISAKCLDCDKSLYADSRKDYELYRKLSMSGKIK